MKTAPYSKKNGCIYKHLSSISILLLFKDLKTFSMHIKALFESIYSTGINFRCIVYTLHVGCCFFCVSFSSDFKLTSLWMTTTLFLACTNCTGHRCPGAAHFWSRSDCNIAKNGRLFWRDSCCFNLDSTLFFFSTTRSTEWRCF